jgi:DNA-binding CsgD family transcriptional regulator
VSSLFALQSDNKLTGLARIQHYSKEEIGIDAQFWSMAEDQNGVLYFGSNKGIAIYDGHSWTRVSLPNNSAVKAVAQVYDGRIFVGGSNEFGTIEKDSLGRYYYESQIGLLNENDRKIEEVWQILSFENKILIRSFESIVILDQNKVTLLPTESSFNYVNYVGGYLYVVDGMGISRLDPNTLELDLLFRKSQFNDEYIISLQPTSLNYELIGFSRNGNAFIFNLKTTSVNQEKVIVPPQIEDQIFCAILDEKDKFLIGTVNNQILSYNYETGTVRPWRKDLQDQTVLNIIKSSDGSIWTMLNKGIDCIETVFPGSTIFDGASVYDALIHNGFFYIASNQGVYAAEIGPSGQLSTSHFKIISSLSAQAWNLTVHNDQVFVGHDRGVYSINGRSSKKVEGTDGVWKVIAVKGNQNLLLACGYNGIYVLEKTDNQYRLRNKIENFDTSSRDIMQTDENGVFWVCHGYEGVYHIKINDEFTKVVAREHYTDKNGLPSQYNINVTTYGENIVFLSKYGFYEFVTETNRFVEKEDLNALFADNLDVSKLVQSETNTWFVQNEQLGYFVENSPTELNKEIFASLNGSFITSMEYLQPLDDTRILVGTNEGVYLFDLDMENLQESIPTLIRSVSYRINSDSTVFAEISNNVDGQLEIPHNMNSLTFDFGFPGLTPKKGVLYSYKLSNFDSEWSEWSKERSKEYSFLPRGDYTFSVKARSVIGQNSLTATFNLAVLPVWYQTKMAWISFLFILALVSFVGYKMVLFRMKAARKEHAKIRKALESEIESVKLQKEKELIEKDNELLAENIVNKSKEIANYTLLLVKKHDLLDEISKEVNEIKKTAKLDKTKNRLRSIAQKIRMNLLDEEHLQIFDTNFERVHQHFFDELKTKFPDLHQKDFRMCGLVKMNMSNKEIASVLGISVRGVETAKYRLRKRLHLDDDVNMVEFLEGLVSPEN